MIIREMLSSKFNGQINIASRIHYERNLTWCMIISNCETFI